MIAEWLASKWAVSDPLPRRCDIIVPVAHGATEDRLTNGARAVAERTACIIKELRDRSDYPALPYLAFGSFSGSENPELERSLKSRIIGRTGRYIGPVISTIEECWKVKQNIPIFLIPQHIIVVTDEAHSRRCRIVWRVFFPNSQIHIISVKIADTVDKESPMLAYRLGQWAILLFQALPTPYFWYLAIQGQKYMESKATSLHQPVAK